MRTTLSFLVAIALSLVATQSAHSLVKTAKDLDIGGKSYLTETQATGSRSVTPEAPVIICLTRNAALEMGKALVENDVEWGKRISNCKPLPNGFQFDVVEYSALSPSRIVIRMDGNTGYFWVPILSSSYR